MHWVFKEDKFLSDVLNRDCFVLEIKENLCGIIENANQFRISLMEKSFVYAKVSADQITAIRFLETNRFNLIDTNVSFSVDRGGFRKIPADETIRFARPEDASSTTVLAGEVFTFSRFHLDPKFTTEEARRVKSEWVSNFFRGKRGDQFIVAEVQKKIVGFLQMLERGENNWIIDLIGVHQDHQRKGLGAKMINFAMENCGSKTEGEVKTMQVGTQLANGSSLRLYERLGFRYSHSAYVFHYHNT